MADKIKLLMESMLPDMLYYLKKKVFEKQEIREIMKEREQNEYLLVRKNFSLSEIMKSIDFEYSLERNRRKRQAELKIKKENERDYQIIKRIIQLWDKATTKYKYDINLWKQYLSFCYYLKSKRLFFKAVTNALSFNSNNEELWQIAANYEFEVNKNPFKARKIYYKGLKVNSKNSILWSKFLEFELKFYDIMRLRKQILEENKEDNDSIDQEGGEDELNKDFIGFDEEKIEFEKLNEYNESTDSLKIFKTIYELAIQYVDPMTISNTFLSVFLNKYDKLQQESMILSPQQITKKILAELNTNLKYSKSERIQLFKLIFKKFDEFQKQTNQDNSSVLNDKQKTSLALEIFKTAIKCLINFKDEFSHFFDIFVLFLVKNNYTQEFISSIYQKMTLYNQNCPLIIYLKIVQDLDWEELQNQNKINKLFSQLSNWFPKEKQMWEKYLQFTIKTNPSQASLVLEKASQISGIPYQDLQMMYNTLIENSE
ncbi:hypothetical protein PPERSA_07319 [Pseudocohnilembus persalinus]|uniref:U3 small nucleolar RNA-associated protein 6 N-terminal domain-containing protein n=1 Tax=Pseudocohnilembus persalinus TaxID=266149 RepID=A0A0V0R7B3_PSEPJ|nr:hypothetical protein PPERSA_07319 [Pseudocohnilembus persalinus]|eukprot:KRX10234.1 hypothetical protein PPERSA_07319 [Pseudocohnilembus persalinus]